MTFVESSTNSTCEVGGVVGCNSVCVKKSEKERVHKTRELGVCCNLNEKIGICGFLLVQIWFTNCVSWFNCYRY